MIKRGKHMRMTTTRIMTVVFSVLFLISSAPGQDIKIFGGVNLANYKEPPPWAGPRIPEISDAYRANDRGVLFGIGLELPLMKAISLDIGAQYSRQGSVNERYYMNDLMNRTTYELGVLGLPVSLKFKPFRRTSPYFLAGGELAYVIRHMVTVFDALEGFSVRDDIMEWTRRFDFSLVFGAGVEIVSSGKWTPFAEVRYHIGLSNLSKGLSVYTEGLYTRALVIQAGVKYRL
jgi:opacity protein-like surface antigen